MVTIEHGAAARRRRRTRSAAWDRPLVMLPLFALIAAVGGLFGSFTPQREPARAGRRRHPDLARPDRPGRPPTRRRPGSTRGAAWWLVPLLICGPGRAVRLPRQATVRLSDAVAARRSGAGELPRPGRRLLRLARRRSGGWCADEPRSSSSACSCWPAIAFVVVELAVPPGGLEDPDLRRSQRLRHGVPGRQGAGRPDRGARLLVVGRLAFLRPLSRPPACRRSVPQVWEVRYQPVD